jgi:hypothetical protein
MNYQVVYFSRTGNSKRIAEKIAGRLSTKAVRITDNVNWNGLLGYLKYIFYMITKKEVNVTLDKKIDNYDELIVVTPLWDAAPCLAVKKFLSTVPLNSVHLVTSAGMSVIKNKDGFKSVNSITVKDRNEDIVIQALVQKLLNKDKA